MPQPCPAMGRDFPRGCDGSAVVLAVTTDIIVAIGFVIYDTRNA